MATYPIPAPLASTPVVGGDVAPRQEPPEGAKLDIPLQGIQLTDVANNPRSYHLDAMESYYRATQDDGKMYDWDGNMMGYGGQADVQPGWYVPMKRRRPCARYDLGKLIVTRLTSMVFGSERFPELRIEGDPDAQDYVRALAEASRLSTRMIEARNLGGAVGTACLSFCFKNGLPRVEVHNAKHCTVLSWVDEDEKVVKAVLKAYTYPRQVFDPEAGKLRTVNYYYARYWDEEREIIWDPIPQRVAETQRWQQYSHKTVEHKFGFCPFYWIQNLPDSQNLDGESDYEGLTENFDQLNQLLSADTKGVKANCDPTLVVKMDPNMNEGNIQKGSNNAIFSPNGAAYLTLPETATKAAENTMEKIRAYTLDVAGVVLTDPEKMSGSAQSAQAMRIIYAPMLAKCDLLREQYGAFGLKRVLLGMLEAARKINGNVVVDMQTGERITQAISLPKRAVRELPDDAEEDVVTQFVDRKPGTSSVLELNWLPYFQPTWADVQSAAEAVKMANGEKAVISQRTGIEAVAGIFGIGDVDQELHQIDEERQKALKLAKDAMGAEDGEDEDEDEDEEAPGAPPEGPQSTLAKSGNSPGGGVPPSNDPRQERKSER
jgi:hypothetical protein